jgi:hypothetical protein
MRIAVHIRQGKKPDAICKIIRAKRARGVLAQVVKCLSGRHADSGLISNFSTAERGERERDIENPNIVLRQSSLSHSPS